MTPDLNDAVKAARAAFDAECNKIGRVLDDPDAAENQPWRAAVAAALNRVIAERDEARDDLAVANAHVGALRARMVKLAATCSCQSWPPEGPSADCAVHGAIRGLNEANEQLTALGARLADAERERDFWHEQQKLAANVAAGIAELDETAPALRQMLRTERKRREAEEATTLRLEMRLADAERDALNRAAAKIRNHAAEIAVRAEVDAGVAVGVADGHPFLLGLEFAAQAVEDLLRERAKAVKP